MNSLLHKLSRLEMDKIVEDLSLFIKDQLELYQKGGFVLGLSGGIDSALTAKLACIAVGSEKIKALILPDKDSDKNTIKDALYVAEFLKINDTRIIDITKRLEAIETYSLLPELYKCQSREERALFIKNALKEFNEKNNILENYRNGQNELLNKVRAAWTSKVRMRMLTLFYYAEQKNLLVLGTTNKTEFEAGWFTKFGDGAVDIEVLAPLYKTHVFQLSNYLGIPSSIIKKEPSADILPGLNDEFNLGITYELLDPILCAFNKNISISDMIEKHGINPDLIKKVEKILSSSELTKKAPILSAINI